MVDLTETVGQESAPTENRKAAVCRHGLRGFETLEDILFKVPSGQVCFTNIHRVWKLYKFISLVNFVSTVGRQKYLTATMHKSFRNDIVQFVKKSVKRYRKWVFGQKQKLISITCNVTQVGSDIGEVFSGCPNEVCTHCSLHFVPFTHADLPKGRNHKMLFYRIFSLVAQEEFSGTLSYWQIQHPLTLVVLLMDRGVCQKVL